MNTDAPARTESPAPAVCAADVRRAFDGLPSKRRFSAAQRELVHRLAFAALAAGELASARRYYEWLVVYGGAEARAWRGLAASAHALGRYGEALMHWTMVSLLEPGAADATLYAGRCQAQLGQVAEAVASFELVRRDQAADASLREQATQLLALLQRRAA